MPRVSQSDRNHIIRAFEDGLDFISLANDLHINRRTAYRIVQTFQRENRRHCLPVTGRHKILTPGMVNSLVSFVEEKPTATLLEMRGHLLQMFPTLPAQLSLTTISRALDGCIFTLTLLRSVPTQWNIEEVKCERAEFASWLLREGPNGEMVFIDECGFNIWTARTQGRSIKGERAVRIVEGQRGQNMTVCLAVSPRLGLVHQKFIEGGMKNELYNDFLSEVSALLFEESVFFVHDNAPSHRNCASPISDIHTIKPLPRYSPFLNMTERAISCLKSDAKRRLTDPQVQVLLGDRVAASTAGLTLHRHRMKILRGKVEDALPSITPFKCHQWHSHSLTYIEKCLNKDDIFD